MNRIMFSCLVGALQHVKIEFSQFHFLFPDRAHKYGEYFIDLHIKSQYINIIINIFYIFIFIDI